MRLCLIREKRKPAVCVDLDGLIARYGKWKGYKHFGTPIDGAREFLKKLSKHARIVILTSRCSGNPKAGPEVEKYLDDNNLKYDEVWTGKGKPPAVAYVDDRGVNCAPQTDDDAFDTAFSEVLKLIDRHAE